MKDCVSIFSQILGIVNRHTFAKVVAEHSAEARSKGFSSWDQFVAMLFAQIGQADSLREIESGLGTCMGKLNHLGLKEAPARSTLSYANNHRPWEVYEQMFYEVLTQCQTAAPHHRFRFKNPLFSLDATVIDLCLSLFEWAKFRTTKGAVKLHLLLNHSGYLPAFAHITEGKVHESRITSMVPLAPGSVVAVDRGYNSYDQFATWDAQGVWFVAREKEHAVYRVVKDLGGPRHTSILGVDEIELNGGQTGTGRPLRLRRIVVWDRKADKNIVLWTNNFELGASTVARVYKDRWQIEVFFKAIKQYLRIKTFVGTTENALKTQLWTALIAILLIKFLQFKSTIGWSLSTLIAMLRFNLFTYR
ncbi:IS4 family transposase, partial [bacterium]|nr:IS4 family transposase [bacterium]